MYEKYIKVQKNILGALAISSLLFLSQGCGGSSSSPAISTTSATLDSQFPESSIVDVPENQTESIQLFDVNDSSLSYAIEGEDSDLFSIDSKTGILTLLPESEGKQEKGLSFKVGSTYSFSIVITNMLTNASKTVPVVITLGTAVGVTSVPTPAPTGASSSNLVPVSGGTGSTSGASSTGGGSTTSGSSSTTANVAPTVSAGVNKTVQVNNGIAIAGTATDSDGTISSFEWKKGSTVLAATATFTYTPTVVGTDTLTLEATDNDGAMRSDTMTVTVSAVTAGAPVNAGVDKKVQVNTSTSLNGTLSSTHMGARSYKWTKGANILATTSIFSYTPTIVGIDTLTFEVIDINGATSSDTIDINVTTIPVPPTIVGLKGHWNFENNLGNSNPLASTAPLPSNGTFTYSNNTSTTLGKALVFDGLTNDLDFSSFNHIMSKPAHWTSHNDFTLSYFVKSDMLARYDHFSQGIACAGTGTFHMTGNINPPTMHLNTDNTAVSSLSANTWTLITVVKKKGFQPSLNGAPWVPATYILYKNGVDQNTSTSVSELFSGNLSFSKGCASNGVSKFKGELDDVRLYDRALSASEILVIYHQL